VALRKCQLLAQSTSKIPQQWFYERCWPDLHKLKQGAMFTLPPDSLSRAPTRPPRRGAGSEAAKDLAAEGLAAEGLAGRAFKN